METTKMDDLEITKLVLSRIDKDADNLEDALGISDQREKELMENVKKVRNLVFQPGDQVKNEIIYILEQCKTPGELLLTMAHLGAALIIATI
jgi:hypothetical protein